ncbi:MAG: hypothetical protein ACI9WL_001472, partial [Rubritalea sp.]
TVAISPSNPTAVNGNHVYFLRELPLGNGWFWRL